MNQMYIARHPAAAWRRLEDEVIVLSGRDSSLFTLNEVAAEIWEAADGRTPLGEIVSGRICANFEVEFDQALRDAGELVQGLASHGLLLISESPIEAERAT